MKHLYLVVILTLLASCNNQNSSKRMLKDHISQIETQIVGTTGSEDFISFFNFFSNDSLFQCDRISIPFELVYCNGGFEEGASHDTVIYYSEKKGWNFFKFKIKGSKGLPEKSLTIKNDTAIIILRNSDNLNEKGIKGVFINSKGKWMCISILNNFSSFCL